MTGISDHSILEIIGNRIADYRLERNLTQTELAKEAGVSKSTVVRLEDGCSIQLVNLIRVLRALNMLENIDTFLPEIPASPLELIKLKGKRRRRASTKRSKPSPKQDWTWGEDK